VPDGAKNVEASWEFLSFLMGPDHITSVSLGDGLSARRSMAEDPNVMEEKFWLQQFVPLMDNASGAVWQSPLAREYQNRFGAAFDYSEVWVENAGGGGRRDEGGSSAKT
jgi:ABC-type glycerol-3-phosphate transport system substrate-binding protein